MSGIFNTLNTGSKGMRAQQIGLHTVSHNITNANTKGYSRQRVEMKADKSYSLAGIGRLGSGVKTEAITRITDELVSKQIQSEGGLLSQYNAKSEVLEQIEVIYNEPSDTGLNFNIGEVFHSWQELGKSPENPSSKSILVQKSTSFADTFNNIRTQLGRLDGDINNLIKQDVENLNANLNKLNSLNEQVFNIALKGEIPNDLLDQRDSLLQEVSKITDINTSFDEWGRVTVSNGSNVILGTGTDAIKDIKYESGVVRVGTEDFVLTRGSIKGYTEAKKEITKQIESFDDFGSTLSSAINDKHKLNSLGAEIDGAIDFFIYDDVKKTLKVNDLLVTNNNLVIAGEDVNSPPGDGSRALSMAQLKNEEIAFGTTNATIEDRYNGMITDVGISKEYADNMVSNQNVIIGQLEMRKESIAGVSIDEEITDMIKYQKAFEANAKVIATLTEMLDVLINRMGV